MERFVAELPSFLAADDDATHELRAYHDRLLGEHRALLRAFGTMVDGDPAGPRFEGAAVCECA